jgi:hypothetical protein
MRLASCAGARLYSWSAIRHPATRTGTVHCSEPAAIPSRPFIVQPTGRVRAMRRPRSQSDRPRRPTSAVDEVKLFAPETATHGAATLGRFVAAAVARLAAGPGVIGPAPAAKPSSPTHAYLHASFYDYETISRRFAAAAAASRGGED